MKYNITYKAGDADLEGGLVLAMESMLSDHYRNVETDDRHTDNGTGRYVIFHTFKYFPGINQEIDYAIVLWLDTMKTQKLNELSDSYEVFNNEELEWFDRRHITLAELHTQATGQRVHDWWKE